MSGDAKWIVGTGVAIIVSVMATGVALGTLVQRLLTIERVLLPSSTAAD